MANFFDQSFEKPHYRRARSVSRVHKRSPTRAQPSRTRKFALTKTARLTLKFARQVLHDCVKARREVELHWRASTCKHIVQVKDVYENTYGGNKCLLVVMEW